MLSINTRFGILVDFSSPAALPPTTRRIPPSCMASANLSKPLEAFSAPVSVDTDNQAMEA